MSIHRASSILISLALTTALAATVSPVVGASGDDGEAAGQLVPPTTTIIVRNQLGFAYPEPPPVPSGPPDEALVAAVDEVFGGLRGRIRLGAIHEIGDAGDPRAAWLLSDLVRFSGPGELRDASLTAFETLTGATIADDPIAFRSPWQSMTDHLIAWDLPALPDYSRWKGELFTLVDPRWSMFFEDPDADIDWRLVTWGGVLMDGRPFGDPNPCVRGCIPALDDPGITDAAGGDWYPDERLIFGVVVGDEARAYPKHIMEIHEMVNDELGGRRLGMPYCTLCGAAQAYLTDDVEGAEQMPVLRTSGLLSRSNKLMYDLVTGSAFDTFLGDAISGPLHAAGVRLEPVSVVTSSWGDWKAAHPDTTIVAEDGGIGRDYAFDPLRGRDDDGPIFPVGDVDERLETQERVLGVIAPDGTPLAFPVDAARTILDADGAVAALGVTVVPDASGVRAVLEDGADVASHEAFWFAWSQFYPETLVWSPS